MKYFLTLFLLSGAIANADPSPNPSPYDKDADLAAVAAFNAAVKAKDDDVENTRKGIKAKINQAATVSDLKAILKDLLKALKADD